MGADVAAKRRELQTRLFLGKIPALWCPMIVHYHGDGSIDLGRMEKHLQKVLPDVSSFLLFGSTGDGWELDQREKETLFDAYAAWAGQYGVKMLLGVLKKDAAETMAEIEAWLLRFRARAGVLDAQEAMAACGVKGFTVCAPRGADLSQEAIQKDLENILQMGLPTALYQLPQMTQNEIAPETLLALADRYPNLFLFKDTSGRDKAVRSGLDFGGVFFVRGMEGDYYRQYAGDAAYPGFLLSTANCFAPLLKQMLEAADQGETELARDCSRLVWEAFGPIFDHTSALKDGNPYANANKCIDHCLAFGDAWAEQPMPMRHCGKSIPGEYIAFAADTLSRLGLMVQKGYLGE